MPKLVDTRARRRLVAEATLALADPGATPGPRSCLGLGGSEDLNEAAASLLAVVDGLFVARCDTVDQIDSARASRVIAETLERLCAAPRLASGGPPGYHG
jgi:hypothetical protein